MFRISSNLGRDRLWRTADAKWSMDPTKAKTFASDIDAQQHVEVLKGGSDWRVVHMAYVETCAA